MAYGTMNRSNVSSSKPTTEGTARPAAIFSTGLFAPTKEGVKSLGNIQVKEDVTIPAGSYINLYDVEKKNDKSPAFRIQVTAGKLKPAGSNLRK